MKHAILTLELRIEHDVVHARQRARKIAQLLGFDLQEQTRIATAVSEIARNAFQYGRGGKIDFSIRNETDSLLKEAFVVLIEDRGDGIYDLSAILSGSYKSKTGMGLGIIGAKRLMDHFHVSSIPGTGTQVQLWKELPEKVIPIPKEKLESIIKALLIPAFESPFEEIQRQNQELLRMIDIVKSRENEIAQANDALKTTNRELEETNRGVVALYTELDEKAKDLKQANEVKSRFLSYMSHEFRTPLNSIIGLSRVLLDRLDGDLTEEQEKQVGFIHRASEDVLEMVNDLLDFSKAEAGKIEINLKQFQLSDLFGALKGLMRPLIGTTKVSLVFEESSSLPTLHSDEGKIAQILRNLISNALKFTECGEIRISAEQNEIGTVSIRVTDTGIGIADENQNIIFEEYSQIDSRLQRKVKGTGLGLPLVKKLVELLGGKISLISELGLGSTFTVTLPTGYSTSKTNRSQAPEIIQTLEQNQAPDLTRDPVLIVEDNYQTLIRYDFILKGTRFQPIPAVTVEKAKELLKNIYPVAIILDILHPNHKANWSFLQDLKEDPKLKNIPVLIITPSTEAQLFQAPDLNACTQAPVAQAWLVQKLSLLVKKDLKESILIIDDEEVSRYLLKAMLSETRFEVEEATNGKEGIQIALKIKPSVIFLDFMMPEMGAFEVIDALQSNESLRNIPVVIRTSKVLTTDERSRLRERTIAILSKETRSRETSLEEIRTALIQARRWKESTLVKGKHYGTYQ